MVQWVHPAHLDLQVRKETRVKLDPLDQEEVQDLQETLENKVLLVHQAKMVPEELKALKDLLVLPAPQGLKDPQAYQEMKDQDLKERGGNLDQRVCKEYQAKMGLKGIKGITVIWGLKGCLVYLVQRETEAYGE